ncbi:MAG: hypothetical protein M3N07_08940, partial [Pseudomonadota bacterium]|nr:hypothetical protein [Pseudomonadota bacterium]
MRIKSLSAVLPLLLIAAAPAKADEVFGGFYAHDIDTPLNLRGLNEGMDFQLGWRGDRIARTPLQPYAFLSAHTEGQTHFAVAGLSAKFGDRLFIRPGLGVALHTGSADDFEDLTD